MTVLEPLLVFSILSERKSSIGFSPYADNAVARLSTRHLLATSNSAEPIDFGS
jgi:hypothetical protein